MTARTYGDKVTLLLGVQDDRPGRAPEPYVTPELLDYAEIARRIRADIKAAQGTGDLPGAPVTYRVRLFRFAGGAAINVWVTGLADDDQAKDVAQRVKAIRDAYNWDGSDPDSDYFDVNFYGQVFTEVTP